MTNYRLTAAAAVATAAASLSLFAVLQGLAWLMASLGAITVVALAGAMTRIAANRAAAAACLAITAALVPPLATQGWPGFAAAVVLLAIAALSATGNRACRALATLATYVSCLLIYLTAVFAHAIAYGAVIPSAGSMKLLGSLTSQATTQFRGSPPIPATRPVDFVAAAGIAAAAIAVDLLTVRLRRPALAGVPLLLVFSVPVASDLSGFGFAQTVTFAAALAGYLALLSADGRQRLRLWGRVVTIRHVPVPDDDAIPDTRELAATGRRIGLAAVCLALLIPLAVPAKPHHIFAGINSGASGSGGTQSGGAVSPLLNVQGQLTLSRPEAVLTYTTTDSDPPQDDYLREYVLNYDPHTNRWLPYASATPTLVRHQQLPAPVPGLAADVPTSTATTRINMAGPTGGPLPLPYAPVRITTGATLAEYPGTLVVTTNQPQLDQHFTVTSRVPEPTRADLTVPNASLSPQQQRAYTQIRREYGSYGGPDSAALTGIARRQTSTAANQLQQAVDLQNWFTSNAFTYTLHPRLPDTPGWLLQFLTTRKRGYCQQFAWAFAVLARLLGIPSRVVVGYTAGTQTASGSWQVTTADAHAWPELYFPAVGWVRFEPTPGGGQGQGTAYVPAYTLPATSTNSGPGTTNQVSPGPTAGNLGPNGTHHLQRPGASSTPGGATSKVHGLDVAGLTAGIVVILLLLVPALTRRLTRRRRWLTATGDAAAAQAAWRELLDDLSDYGFPVVPSESPRAAAGRLAGAAGLDNETALAVARICQAQERAMYARSALPGAGLRDDVTTVRRALARGSDRAQRLRALLLPPSTMAALGTGLQSVNWATTWIDWSLPSLGRRLRLAASGRRAR